jgi:hypothetical protein
MKGHINKLVLLMIITVIASFILAATVLADPPGHRAIRGQYAAAGGGTCFLAHCGFNNLVPNYGIFDLMTFSTEAVFTFTRDGKGHVERTNPTVTHTGNPGTNFLPYAWTAKDSWDFTYAIEPDGSITLTQVPGSHSGIGISGPMKDTVFINEGRNRRGTVSPDGKTIILNGGEPDFVTFASPILPNPGCEVPQMICNDSAVLIWQHN